MDRSAIILIENFGGKFEESINFAKINGKPLLKRVTDVTASIVEETIVVADSVERAEKYRQTMDKQVQFVVNKKEPQNSLTNALTGFEKANGKYSILLPSNAPFVSKDVIQLLFELCINRNAAVPRDPDQQIEPFQSVYRTEIALTAAREAFLEGKCDLSSVIEKMQGVRYVSTMVIEQLDPDFKSFFRVRTPLDLKKATEWSTDRRKKR